MHAKSGTPWQMPGFILKQRLLFWLSIKLHKNLEAEFSDCDYVSGPLSHDTRIWSDMTKKQVALRREEKGQFCIRTEWSKQIYFLCYFYKQIV